MEYDVLEAKDWVFQQGCYPARIVLLKIKKAGDVEYSTHRQCDASQDGGSKHLQLGHYFTDIEDAVKDFKQREI